MGDTEPHKPGGESLDNGKRDRQYGMFQDPLVMERTQELKDGLNRELRARSEDGRLAAIYAFVGQHRPGKPTGIRPPFRGSYNVVFVVDFTDGSALLRVGVPGNVISPDEKIRAEVATMRYVEKMTSIPVPHIYHWGTAAENPLGLGPFIIMEYIPHHQSLSDVLKDPTVEDTSKAYLDPDLPRDKLARVYRQAADVLLQLSRLEMPRIGALRQDTPDSGQKTEKFRLWMDDLRPQNILVDANLNIVGVIDWEWAYFAPESYVQDPPWWLLIERPEYWCGTVLEFRDEFLGVLDVFLDALRTSEEGGNGRKPALERASIANRDSEPDNEWSIDRHVEALNLNADTTVRLSDCIRQSWDSGLFWANYAARKCYGFEPVFWEFLDERFFGENVQGGYEGRMHLLSEKAKRRMEVFVERKVEEMNDEKIVDWDAGEARSYLTEIFADLDE
ncbi:kinase-like domain-containing protein [Staphylotrichum tortipilum]|uniref:Kinase-like domain-containing protein n=1 Tax=Staphylotrichum tortipilum TaxID=2831512 RepID=A0AAN6MIJ6_9PEZI|nr:kinase-like domain-containing protein [Staphylotrichum longicolle]